MNKLYSFPNCDKCVEAKKILKQKKVDYEEVDAGEDEGLKKFKKFYKNNKDSIKRGQDGIVLPVLILDDHIYQGLENIIKKVYPKNP